MAELMMGKLSLGLEVGKDADLPLPPEALMMTLAESEVLRLAETGETPDLVIHAEANQIFRLQRQGDPVALAAFRIPVKRARALPLKLQRILEQIVAFQTLQDLAAPSDVLSGALKVEYLQLVEPATRKSEPVVSPLESDPQGGYRIKSGQFLAVALTNLMDAPVFVYLTVLDPRQQSAGLVYPYTSDMPARIRPGESVLVGSGPRYLVEMGLPEGQSQATDQFKLWVSTKSIQPTILELPPLGQEGVISTDPYGAGSRLDRDLRRAILGKVGLTPFPSLESDPWWCESQRVTIVS